MRFQDKVVLVRGGSSGIGLAAAKGFAAEGARVHFTGRSWRTIEEAQAAIPGSIGHQSDIADPAATEDLIARIEAADERIRSEEHTSELQSRENLVCRLPL